MSGIQPIYKAFYIQSMLFNSSTAIAAMEHANIMLGLVEDEDEIPSDMKDEILNSVQSIIMHSAALSRYFWPVRERIELHKKRGDQLRKTFKMTDDSPLKNRTLRDHLEHFDEKLDNHLQQVIVGYIFPKYVGFSPSGDEPPHHLFRAYFIDTGVFQILNEKYEMEPLINEIYRVHDLLQEMAR